MSFIPLSLNDTFETWKNKFNQAISDINTAIDDLIPKNHASTATTYGVGNANNYGHLKLSDATNSTSGVSSGVAATPAAVKTAYDKASTLATSSAPGIVKPDNRTITVQNGIISAKAMETIKGITVINNDFNNLVDAGMYYIATTKGTTKNSPIDVTAGWWVKVSVYEDSDGKRIIQEARMHSTTSSSATSGVANYLARCCTGTTWGPWEYAYTQFAG